jgi:hypothetical protein
LPFPARPESAIAGRTKARPSFQQLLDILIVGKLALIGLGYTLLEFLNLPPFQIA